jgi:hypothetical protein
LTGTHHLALELVHSLTHTRTLQPLPICPSREHEASATSAITTRQ